MTRDNSNTMQSLDSWGPAPESLTVDSGEIHVWRARLNANANQLSKYHYILSVDEQDRSARFKFQKDRERFIAAHGILRIILSRYLDTAPDRLRFSSNEYGKPYLNQQDENEQLRFNMSHSGDLSLVAVTRDHEIGIDLEYIRPLDNAEQIAQRFFSSRENEQFRSLPEHKKNEAFFHCWVRKEAYIKARGKGLFLPLDQFDVSLTPDKPAAFLNSREHPRETLYWSLVALHPHPDFAAALSAEGHDYQLQYWQWTE